MQRLFLIAFVAVACACAGGRVVGVPDAGAQRCRGPVDFAGQAVDRAIVWHSSGDVETDQVTPLWCATVGPPIAGETAHDGHNAIDEIVVVSWNVQVGGGDLTAFVNDLRAGGLTGGTPARAFVLLLQEVFRSGPLVPPPPEHGPVPDRIEERTPAGHREDIVRSARALGLSLLYVPSMRNGGDTGDRAEDRGNAIVSTLPLGELTAIELPLGRGRRVAVAASVTGLSSSAGTWRLRVASGHLDTGTGAGRLWIGSERLRERQAERLAAALAGTDAAVLGADLNTWAAGTGEPAYQVLRRTFPATLRPDAGTAPFALTLDHLFLRLPPPWIGETRTLRDDFGSDHRPLIGRLRILAGATAAGGQR